MYYFKKGSKNACVFKTKKWHVRDPAFSSGFLVTLSSAVLVGLLVHCAVDSLPAGALATLSSSPVLCKT